MKNIETSAF